jgi:hypothetical protein
MRTSAMEEEVTADTENYTVTNLIICTLHKIHYGNQIKEKRYTEQDVHIWEITNKNYQNDSKDDYCHIGCETMVATDVY